MAVEAVVVIETLRRLGYQPGELSVTDIQTAAFGHRVMLDMDCGDGNAPACRIVFEGCTELHWDVFVEQSDLVQIDLPDVSVTPAAEIIKLGATRMSFKDMTEVHTELFDLRIAHSSARLQIGEHDVEL